MPEIVIGHGGRRINLRPQDVLGSGGEGMVFRALHGNTEVAVKIYQDPTPRKSAKLKDLQKLAGSLPDEVLVPLELVWDARVDKVIGFAMRLLLPGQQVFETLISRRHRETYGINTREVTDLYIRLYGVLQALHKVGMIVGDLSSYNVLYKIPEIALIDADSFQFGLYPCEVATERFLNPRLYGINLSLKPCFEEQDDWYSFLVLFFSSILLVHPYGGAHRTIRTITKRALSRLTVIDPSVTYPVVAYPPKIVSDELMQLFCETFKSGKLRVPDLRLFEEYRTDLINCPKCDLWYPFRLKNCPGCQAQNLKAQVLKVQVSGVSVSEIFSAPGPFVFLKIVDSTIYGVAIEQGEAVLYLKEQLAKTRKIALFKAAWGARYDIFAKYLVVCPDPYEEMPKLYLFDISQAKPAHITTTVTERFGDRGGVFRGTARYLYRQVGGVLLRGNIPQGKDLAESVTCLVTEKQTWFDAAPDSDQELLFGFYRTFDKYDWFILLNGVQKPVKIPDLEKGESLVDRSIRFSSSSILLLRRTRKAGEDFCRIDMVGLEDNTVSSRRVSLLNSPQYANIHNLAYARGTILIPENSGLLAENAKNGNQKSFPATANFVDDQSQIWPWENGILVVSGNKVIKIVMGK